MFNAVGDVVRYRNDFWVVVEDNDTGFFKIMRPHVGNEKRHVSMDKCDPTAHKLTKVNYKGKDVLCSPKGTIISLVSLRLLKNNTPDGRAMLACAFQ